MNILIVEDDPVIRTDLKSLLKHNGLKVGATAKNGIQALDILANGEVNFVILDIHLGPGDSGIDVAESIHSKYHLPYIFLTSFSDDETLTAAQEQAPYGYIVKPFQEKTLLTTIKVAWSNWNRIQTRNISAALSNHDQLTQQEKLITEQLIQGKSYKEICSELHISENTLKFHVKNIYSKVDVKGRSELTAKLLG